MCRGIRLELLYIRLDSGTVSVYHRVMEKDLSSKQLETLNYLRGYFSKHKKAPMLSEIAVAIGVNTVSTVDQHLSALEKKGYISRMPGVIRGIILNAEDEGTVDISLLGEVAAGNPIEAIEDKRYVRVSKRVLSSYHSNYFGLIVRGESMVEDGIYDGELVIIEGRSYAKDGDLVVAKDDDGCVTLKYFYKEKNRIRLEPRNPNFEPIYLRNCEVIGILRGLTSDYEYI